MEGNGFPVATTTTSERYELEKRVLGAALYRPEHLAAVSSVLGPHGTVFLRSGFGRAYEIAAGLGADVSLFGVQRVLIRDLGEDAPKVGDLAEYIDLAGTLTTQATRKLTQDLVSLHETARAVAYCADVTRAVQSGEDYAESMADLLGALDRARGSRDEIRPWTLTELRAAPPARPDPILGDGVFSRGDWMLIHARENVGKTWALLELALALATGRDWYGIPTHRRHRVAIVSLEMGSWHAISRIGAVWDGLVDLEQEDQIREIEDAIHIVTKDQIGFLDLSEPTRQRWLSGWLQEREIDVVLLDPLSHFLAGDEDRMGLAPILRYLEGLYHECGASPVLSHHDRKSSTQGDHGDHGSSARGSSTIMASARASFRIVAKRDDPSAPIELHCDKASNGPKPAPIWLRQDEQTGRLVVTSSPSAKRDGNLQAVLDALADGPMTTTQMAEAMEGRASKRTVERYLRSAEKDGLIHSSWIREPGSKQGVARWTLLDGPAAEIRRSANPHKPIGTRDTRDTDQKTLSRDTTEDPEINSRHSRQLATNDTVATGSDWEETF